MILQKWQIQDAKAKFSQLINSLENGDQFITYRGDLVAVVVSKKRYDELTTPSGTLLDFFKNSPLQDVDLEIERSRDFPREVDL